MFWVGIQCYLLCFGLCVQVHSAICSGQDSGLGGAVEGDG